MKRLIDKQDAMDAFLELTRWIPPTTDDEEEERSEMEKLFDFLIFMIMTGAL